MIKKVVITGINIVSSPGFNIEENWAGLTAGKNGVAPISLFDASGCETKIAAQVPDGFYTYAIQFCKNGLPIR